MQLFIVSGCLYSFAIGPYTSYYLFTWLCCIIPVIFSISFYFMPESPYYCVTKGRIEQAMTSLKFLRGTSDETVIQAELDKIQVSTLIAIQNEKLNAILIFQTTIDEARKDEGSGLDIVTNKGNVRALTICLGLIMFQEFSGINGILLYCHQIFSKTGSSFDSSISSILVASVQVLASACTPFVADRLGRRLILLASALGMVVFLVSHC
jgi:MFS family permease